MKLGRNERRAMEFIKQCNGWHSFDGTVRREILSLERKGLVIVSHSTSQFRVA